MKHDFVIIAGAQRSGSTYLYHVLNDHPELLMAKMFPNCPETKFFLNENINTQNFAAYLERFFPSRVNYRVLGEKSVSYLPVGTSVALRIKSMLPEVKIVIVLRDPVYRALSHYCYTEKYGFEKRALEEAFAELEDMKPEGEASRVSYSPFSYLERGHYHKQIQRYEEVFGLNQMRFVVLENFVKDKNELKALYAFVGVQSDFVPKSYGAKFRESDRQGVIPSEALVCRLTEYFKGPNRKLKDAYQLDLSQWLG